MPLPIFPTEEGAPGDGSLIALYGGSPATTEVIGGLIHFAQAIEVYPQGGVGMSTPQGRKGEQLLDNGVTIWLEGSLNLDIRGQPTVTDYADMLARWDTIRAKFLETSYELFLYYHPSSPTTYRKYKSVGTYSIRSFWNNPVSLHFVVAAVATDRTVYTTGPGL